MFMHMFIHPAAFGMALCYVDYVDNLVLTVHAGAASYS